MDRRRKPADADTQRAKREAFYAQIDRHDFTLPQAVRAMQQLSGLTQAEFATHRGVSLPTLKKLIKSGDQHKVETLNKVAEVFGLELAFVRKRPKTRA